MEGGYHPRRSRSNRTDQTLEVQEPCLEHLGCIVITVISSSLSGIERTQEVVLVWCNPNLRVKVVVPNKEVAVKMAVTDQKEMKLSDIAVELD